jgi:cell wall assembly regulator SMI1
MDSLFTNRFSSELNYFTNRKGISLLSPANDEEIQTSEKNLGCKFSPQMALFWKQFNGGRIIEITIKGVQFLGVRKIDKGLDIVESNQVLRTFDGWNLNWLEIGEDGFGNYYVVDLNRKLENGEYPVLFVDHEAIGEEDASTEYAGGYFEFVLKAISEMKQIYTPNGDLKDLNNKR